MRIKGGGYASYATHSYCKRCELWQPIVEGIGRCVECNYMTRKNAHYRAKGSPDTRWDKAY